MLAGRWVESCIRDTNANNIKAALLRGEDGNRDEDIEGSPRKCPTHNREN